MVARSIPKNYRNVTGRFASAKNQNLIGFESTLEKDFFLLLEFDRRSGLEILDGLLERLGYREEGG